MALVFASKGACQTTGQEICFSMVDLCSLKDMVFWTSLLFFVEHSSLKMTGRSKILDEKTLRTATRLAQFFP